MTTTVLLCYPPGWSGSTLYGWWCQGWAHTDPNVAVNVPYTATLKATSITDGVTALDAALKSTPGQVVAMGHSQGAQVISRWLRTHATDMDAPDPARVSFLLTGNPLRPLTGRIIGANEVDGITGQPTLQDTDYRIVDVARQHDGWAIKGPLWGRNGLIGMFGDHLLYRNVNINDPAPLETWTDGFTTYRTVR